MRKLFLTLATLLLLCQPAWAANRYFLKVGGNFSDTTKWAASSASANTNTNDGATPVTGDQVFFDNTGNCAIDANTASLRSLDMTGYTGALSGTSRITVQGATASTNVCKIVGIGTWTGQLNLAPASSTAIIQLTTNSNLLTTAQFYSSLSTANLIVLQDNLAFTAVKTNTFIMENTNFNGFTVTGNSVTNRVRINSFTLGTPSAQNTNALATTFNNVDFRDITFTTAGALDLTNGGVNSIGDCGGNTASGGALTFTTAQNPTTLTGNSVSLSASAAQWSGGRVPLPQDTGVISLTAGQTLTVDEPRLWNGLSFGTATLLTLSNAVTSYGSVNLTGMGTFAGAFSWTFESQARSGNITLTSNAKNLLSVTYSMVNTTLTLQDALTGTSAWSLTNGTFNDGGFNVSYPSYVSIGSATRSLIKSGSWTATASTAGSRWNITSSLSITDTGTFIISDTGANQKTFDGAGLNYYKLQTPSGTGGVLISGSNSFNRITAPSGGTITLTNATTQTITSRYGLANGTNVVTVVPSAGTATIAHQGTTAWDYVNLTNILYSGGTGYAGPLAHSTDGGGNTNWVFTQAPRGRMARFKGRTIGYPGVSRSGAFNAS